MSSIKGWRVGAGPVDEARERKIEALRQADRSLGKVCPVCGEAITDTARSCPPCGIMLRDQRKHVRETMALIWPSGSSDEEIRVRVRARLAKRREYDEP